MKKYYEREFKIQVCKEIEKGTSSVSYISKEYGISRPIVSRWLAEYQRYKNKAFSGKGNRLPDQAKLYALEKKVETLELENEILKKFERFVKQTKK